MRTLSIVFVLLFPFFALAEDSEQTATKAALKAKGPKQSSEQVRQIAEFLTHLKPKIPQGWKLHAPTRGVVRPYGWEKGRGCHILVYHENAPVVAGKRAPWTDLHVWIMDSDYRVKIPLVHASSRPATEIATWRQGRVFFLGDEKQWPTNKSDVLAALEVSDGTTIGATMIGTEQLRKSLTASKEELQRREAGEGAIWNIPIWNIQVGANFRYRFAMAKDVGNHITIRRNDPAVFNEQTHNTLSGWEWRIKTAARMDIITSTHRNSTSVNIQASPSHPPIHRLHE